MKRIAAFVLIFALTLSVFMLPASAISPNRATETSLSETVSPTDAELQRLYTMVEAANLAIEVAVRLAQLTPYNDIAQLQVAVACITAPVFLYAEKIGAEVVCEYTAYKIDGQVVLIDPLRVVNIKPPARPPVSVPD